MTQYIMDVTFTFQSDLTEKEIMKIKHKKGNILTSDKIKIVDFHETWVYELLEKEEEKETTCSCQWEVSEGTDSIWNNLDLDMVDLYTEYEMDDATQKELQAWIEFSMWEETGNKSLEDLWVEFKESYKA